MVCDGPCPHPHAAPSVAAGVAVGAHSFEEPLVRGLQVWRRATCRGAARRWEVPASVPPLRRGDSGQRGTAGPQAAGSKSH